MQSSVNQAEPVTPGDFPRRTSWLLLPSVTIQWSGRGTVAPVRDNRYYVDRGEKPVYWLRWGFELSMLLL